jgi:hypothetical protein
VIREYMRPALGLLFVILVPLLPAGSPWTATVFVLALLAYIVARVLVLVEPEARRFIVDHPIPLWMHIGEAVFVTLALILAMVLAHERDLVSIGIGAGTILAIGYLLVHGVGLVLTENLLGTSDAPPREGMRKFMIVATFIAEESVLLSALVTAEGARVDLLNGPWQPWRLLFVPIFPIVLLIACYIPISRIGRAAGDPERVPTDAIVVQIAALYVYALTGTLPL